MRNRPDAVMIFAAGKGTRMAPLTDRMPKPLIEVCGKALIDHALDLVAGAGLSRIVVNSHHLAPMLQAHLAGRGVTVLHEEVLLETGGGLKAALPVLGDGPVVTLNSDAVWAGPNPLVGLLDAWDEGMDALLSVVPPSHVHGRALAGDFAVEEGRITGRGGPWVYTGAQVIDPARVAEWPEEVFSMNKPWDRMIESGRLFGNPYDGHWCDVGRPEGIAAAEAMVRDV